MMYIIYIKIMILSRIDQYVNLENAVKIVNTVINIISFLMQIITNIEIAAVEIMAFPYDSSYLQSANESEIHIHFHSLC